ARLPANAILLVLDRQGLVLARYPDLDGWSGRELPPNAPLRQVVTATTSQTTELTGLDGIARLFAVTPIEGDGVVVVGVPRAAAFAEADRLLTRNVLGLLAATVIAF